MTVPAPGIRLRPVEWVLLAAALAWSAALPLGAWLLPVYSVASMDSVTGAAHAGRASFVDVNGPWVLWYAVIPLAATVIVAALLFGRDGGAGAGPVTWAVVGLLAAFTVAGLATIGLLVLPVTGCLVAWCSVRQHRARRTGRSSGAG